MEISITADHVAGETPIDPERVLLLNTIALSEKKFKEKSDFVAQQLGLLPNWEEYYAHFAFHTLTILKEIRNANTSILIDYDVGFTDFTSAMFSGRFDAVFLIAHHIAAKNKIEFSGSATSVQEIIALLEQLPHARPVRLILFACNSTDFDILRTERKAIHSIATAFWEMPVINSYIFVKYWISFLDGKATLSEAYHKAMDAAIAID